MREPVRTLEARRGVGGGSKVEIQAWGAIVSGYTSEGWPPADWSLSAEVERQESVRSYCLELREREVRTITLPRTPVNKSWG
jgi:hypothetical protein